MKNILLIGGTKFIGSMLVDLFLDEGAKVYILSRSAPKQKNVQFLQGDRNNKDDLHRLKQALGDIEFDCVYDMCCYEPAQVKPVFDVVANHTKRIVLFSSAAVYARTEIFPLHESSMLGENESFGNYGTNKAAAERLYSQFAEEQGIQVTIFRPHYILGKNDYFLRHQYFYSRIEDGQRIPVPGNGQAIVQFANAPEVAELFYTVPFAQQEKLEILNVASEELLTLDGLIESFASSIGEKAHIEHIDYAAAGLDEKNFYDELFPFPNLNLILDTSRARQVYRYPASPLATYIGDLSADWKERKSEYGQIVSKFDDPKVG